MLHPSAPSYSKDIPATSGRCSCKSTKIKWNNALQSKKSAKKSPKVWKIREKCLSLQRQKGEFAERMTTFMACKGRFDPHPYEPSLNRVVALLVFYIGCWGTVMQYWTKSWLERCKPTVNLTSPYFIMRSFSNCFWFRVFRFAGCSPVLTAHSRISVRRNTASVDS